MKIKVKDFGVQVELGNKGITFDVRTPDDKSHCGDIQFGKAKIKWCPGRANAGYTVTWAQLITWIEANGKKS